MDGEIIGLVPVKGSSERIGAKNIRKFDNTTLFELKLEQISRVQGLDRVVVSSENEVMLNIAREKGFDVHVRDPKYSTSEIPMSEVYSYIASEVPGEHIAWINVTNPLAESEAYDRAVEVYRSLDSTYDCLLSVVEVQDYLFHNGKPVNFQPKPWPKSQDLSGVCAMSFVINMLRRKDMVRWGSCVGTSPYFFYLDRVTSWDVDFQEDFDFCEMIYRQRKS
jgi:N-acylneuraminate cytidylyltransferase